MNRVLAARDYALVRFSGWRLATATFTAAVAVLLLSYWPTVRSLVSTWAHDGTYQYAFLIFPLGLWLGFGLRHQLRANPPRPSVWGLGAVAVCASLWYAGVLLDVNLVQHFAFTAMFPALVLACWGWRALRVLAFPLAYVVVFAVPWGNGLVGPLQDITATFAVHALDVTGIPVLLNGREIITPSATWMVEEACSGVKFFIACAALGCLFAYLMYQRPWKRVAFVALAAVVPVVANGLRVYFTVLIGETFGLEYATGVDHMIFGWQFFGTVLVLLLLAGWFFRDPPMPVERPPANRDRLAGARVLVWPLAFALLVAAPLLAARGASTTAAPIALRITAPEVAGWNGPHPASGGWSPSFEGAAGQFRVAYVAHTGKDPVDVFHAVYTGKSRPGHDLVTFGNDVYDPERARLLATEFQRVHFADGSTATAKELRLAGPGGTRLVWYWYCVDGRCTGSAVVTKLWQAWDVLRGRVSRSSVWALSTPVAHGNATGARRDLLAFAKALPGADSATTPAGDRRAASGDPR